MAENVNIRGNKFTIAIRILHELVDNKTSVRIYSYGKDGFFLYKDSTKLTYEHHTGYYVTDGGLKFKALAVSSVGFYPYFGTDRDPNAILYLIRGEEYHPKRYLNS